MDGSLLLHPVDAPSGTASSITEKPAVFAFTVTRVFVSKLDHLSSRAYSTQADRPVIHIVLGIASRRLDSPQHTRNLQQLLRRALAHHVWFYMHSLLLPNGAVV